MIRKVIYVGFFGAAVALIGVATLEYKLPVGPIVLGMSTIPLMGLILAGRSFSAAIPDVVFGAIDTGLLAILAVCGGVTFGVAGAIAGGVIGDAVTDGIAGFFEGGIAKWLRGKGIDESRDPVTTALGKMAGCLFGSGVAVSTALLLGVQVRTA